MAFPRATEVAHLLFKGRIRHGDRAIDATVGNGHDTLFLAECVGRGGRVDGFDIQEAAIESARHRVASFPWVFLHTLGHEGLDQVVTTGIAGAMFNLGYLPSGDKAIITRPTTTISGLSAALGLLSENGLITVIVYPGHPGGQAEAKAIDDWVSHIDPNYFRAIHYGPTGNPDRSASPYLLAIERIKSRTKPGLKSPP